MDLTKLTLLEAKKDLDNKKISSVELTEECIKNIFAQGRCALVINIQMYKIFILNSLLTIYIESFIALKGIKFSEYQTVYLGFAVSMLFLMFSKAKPLNKVNSKSVFVPFG